MRMAGKFDVSMMDPPIRIPFQSENQTLTALYITRCAKAAKVLKEPILTNAAPGSKGKYVHDAHFCAFMQRFTRL